MTAEVDAFRQALRSAGVTEKTDFEFERLQGQGHSSRTVDEQLEKWSCITDFLDRKL